MRASVARVWRVCARREFVLSQQINFLAFQHGFPSCSGEKGRTGRGAEGEKGRTGRVPSSGEVSHRDTMRTRLGTRVHVHSSAVVVPISVLFGSVLISLAEVLSLDALQERSVLVHLPVELPRHLSFGRNLHQELEVHPVSPQDEYGWMCVLELKVVAAVIELAVGIIPEQQVVAKCKSHKADHDQVCPNRLVLESLLELPKRRDGVLGRRMRRPLRFVVVVLAVHERHRIVVHLLVGELADAVAQGDSHGRAVLCDGDLIVPFHNGGGERVEEARSFSKRRHGVKVWSEDFSKFCAVRQGACVE